MSVNIRGAGAGAGVRVLYPPTWGVLLLHREVEVHRPPTPPAQAWHVYFIFCN